MASRRTPNWRLVALLTAIAVLGTVAVAGFLLRGRDPSVTGSPRQPGVPEPTGTQECTPGQEGPLRADTQFTAKDDAQTLVHYSISLPSDYYTACKTYPVLYALHGKEEDNISFLTDALSLRKPMDAGVLEQAIIVTPDSYSTGRWENRETGPAEDNFITYLIPRIEQNYRVKPGASNRLLAGFSMGGHGAFRFGLKYPDMFAAVWSVDGAMAGSEDYLPFAENKTSADFHILSVGGQLNGDRVQTLVNDLGARGITIPYAYQDVPHEFTAFVDADEQAGWYAMKFLQAGLSRAS